MEQATSAKPFKYDSADKINVLEGDLLLVATVGRVEYTIVLPQ